MEKESYNKEIKSKETENIRLTLIKNIIKDMTNFSVITFSKKYNLEVGRDVFDTERKALNYFNTH